MKILKIIVSIVLKSKGKNGDNFIENIGLTLMHPYSIFGPLKRDTYHVYRETQVVLCVLEHDIVLLIPLKYIFVSYNASLD